MNKSKVGYISNIESDTLENQNFRKVLFTGKKMQLVVMNLNPKEEIGMEVHEDHDQFIRIEDGEAEAFLDGEVTQLHNDDVLIIPAGTEHNLTNTSDSRNLKLYTIYAPPEHPSETVDVTKQDALNRTSIN